MTSYRFPAKERLKSSRDIERLYRQGEHFIGKWMDLYSLPASKEQREVGISCRRGGFNKSVVRNRVKRRLRECYRLHKGLLKEGVVLLIVAKKEMGEEPPFAELTKEFLSLCQNGGILKE